MPRTRLQDRGDIEDDGESRSSMDVDMGTEEVEEVEGTDDGYESCESSSLIRKPPGEVGRPGRGGYNLQKTLRDLGWSTKSFEKKKKVVFDLIDGHLDTGMSFAYQDDDAVQAVIDAAKERFPEFGDFKDAWPILDFCKLRLKYTASRAKRNAERLAAEMFDAQQVTLILLLSRFLTYIVTVERT
ncbi:hypothetical protein ACEPAG_3745 [Sanghuangporus baumii]